MSSIYGKLKRSNEYDGESGKEEVGYLYFYPEIPMRIKISLADDLVESIIDISKSEEKDAFLSINDFPLITYSDILISKVNTLVKEEVISENWIKDFTSELIFNGEDEKAVQLGLVLSEKYLEKDELLDVVSVFSKSGQYIFYLKNSIFEMNKYNSFLLDLAKKSSGTIKVFAITNIEPINIDIISYLIEESYKGEREIAFLINYIMLTVDISEYMMSEELSSEQVNNLGYIIQYCIRSRGFRSIDVREEIVNNYIPLAIERGSDIYCLYSMLLIQNEIKKDNDFKLNRGNIQDSIEKELSKAKWEEVFKNSIKDSDTSVICIIELAKYYNYKLSFDELLPFIVKNSRDVNLYEYVTVIGSAEERIRLFEFFSGEFDIDYLTSKAQDLASEDLDTSYIDDILFLFIVKALRKIHKEGRALALKALNARINDTRWQAISILERYRDFSKKEISLIKAAIKTEPNTALRNRLESLIIGDMEFKREFINTNDIKVVPFVDDIYLMSTNIAGSSFRNQSYLQDELEESRRYYLALEENNPYDKNAVKVVGESGYVIGYIPKNENNVLSNLLKGGKYIYAVLEEYNLNEAYIRIKVYLSLKDVLDYCENTIELISYPESENKQ